MECPFCGIEIKKSTKGHKHPNKEGRLVTKESGGCPHKNADLSNSEWVGIEVALIDIYGD